ncbi:MAG: hypothetical protein V3S64_11615 [bacterium]
MAKSGALPSPILGQMALLILGRLTGHRFHSLPPFRRRMGHSAGKTAAFSLLLSCLLLSGFGGIASSQQRGLLPGEIITLDKCLQFSVLAMRDRDGVLDHFDWITVRVENDCAESRRFLVVELVVIDPVGRAYGGKLWVLGRGERLLPGGAKTEHYAVPDPGNRKPHRWLARLVYVQGPGLRRKPPLPRTVRRLNVRRLKTRRLKTRLRIRRIR